MLRWTMPILTGFFAIGSAVAADLPDSRYPSGPGVYYKSPPVHGRRVYVEEERDLLFTPTDGSIPYIPPLIRAPLLHRPLILSVCYGFAGNVNPGFAPKKSNGRITKSCHITGITGQSSARGT